MTLSKRRDGYLNQRVILFRLKYGTHSLQMHPELPRRSVFILTTKLSEKRYALRLVVIPSKYFTIPSPFFQPILPSLSSHIYSVAVPHLLHRRIHSCLPHLRHHARTPLSSLLIFYAIPIIPERQYSLRLAVVPC